MSILKYRMRLCREGIMAEKSCEGPRVLAIRTESQGDREPNKTKESLVK